MPTRPKKKKAATSAYEMTREFKLRLPPDLSAWIEQRAKAKGWPQNRAIINALSSVDGLEKVADFGESLGDLKVLIARHSARISWHDLSDDLLNAVDAVLKAEGGAREAAIDRLSVVRSAMLKFKRLAKE